MEERGGGPTMFSPSGPRPAVAYDAKESGAVVELSLTVQRHAVKPLRSNQVGSTTSGVAVKER